MISKTIVHVIALVGLLAHSTAKPGLDAGTLKKTVCVALKKLGTTGMIAIPTIAALLFAQKYWHTQCTINREWLTYGRLPGKDTRAIECNNKSRDTKNESVITKKS